MEQSEPKTGWLQRLKAGLSKTRQVFVKQLDTLLSGRKIDDDLLEELETLLITSDFGLEATRTILDEARERCLRARETDADNLRAAMAAVIRERLGAHQGQPWKTTGRPHVVLVVGVNGVGKTTTIGKLAHEFESRNLRVMLAAGDTFRAAAVEQLKIWGNRANCPVVAQEQNADSAAVAHDALMAARSRNIDLLLVDTAGRLHTKVNLMEELKKIKRVLGRIDPAAPHDCWLVLDATTGQNAINQARLFHEAMGLTGLIVTKLDGTAKGGVVVSISERFHLPIRFIGVGEGLDELKPFDPQAFVEALFGR